VRACAPVGLVLVALVALGGCGGSGSFASPADGGDPRGADATLPTDASAFDGGSGGECPTALPVDGTACDAPGLWCEYGGGAHGRCSTRASCAKKSSTGGLVAWTIFAPPDLPCTNVNACPTDFASSDAGCPAVYGACDYDAGRCACAECVIGDGGGPPWPSQWQCRAWGDVSPFLLDDAGPANAPGACPPDRPRLGTPCGVPGIVCGYDACYGISLGPYLACENGRWAMGPQTDLCNPPTCL